MNTLKTLLSAGALVIAGTLAAPAAAQESSYKNGPVWEVSDIHVLPGQSENYMDYLSTTWKKVQELGKAEGIVLDYHVLVNNNRRNGEPELYLVVIYRDYQTNAQQEAFEKKVNALLAQDRRIASTASAGRGKMREQMGSAEMQELVLK
ncbi:MAG: hypothetical protein JSR28_12570 [Proteobacteria bacterium]|nr:hypothetical protein [Pseudomonadota bacterium]